MDALAQQHGAKEQPYGARKPEGLNPAKRIGGVRPVAQKPVDEFDHDMPTGLHSQKDSNNHGDLSRGEFRQELREQYSGSGLNEEQRLKIEKEYFPERYGSEISAGDIKDATHRAYQKWDGEHDPAKKELVQKELNYLKKLGEK
jgi:hypothetical protein